MTGGKMHSDLPELVPARMVNEFTYCPRLFYLEWVQAQFTHNADTAEGSWQHRAVDRQTGAVPLPDDESDVLKATSVTLSSDRLGLIAKLDLLEGHDGKVRPVDTKKGSPPDDTSAWEPELVQLCVQGLLLRDNGYECDEGVLWFAETRQRRTIVFDDVLVHHTLQLVEELRHVASSDNAPSPLIDSPKCPRCSLVGLCMPDEVNSLAGRTERPPRRLVPSDPSSRPLYVTEHGVTIGLKSGRIEITRKKELIESALLLDISQINVFGVAQVTTQLLRECFRQEIPVAWFSHGGWFSGMAEGLPSKHVALRMRQAASAAQGDLSLARSIVEGKIRNCRVFLRRNADRKNDATFAALKQLADQTQRVDSIASLLGIEGSAARLYFADLPSMLKNDDIGTFDFTTRNRRPPADPVNCLLSFVYSLIVKDLTATVWTVGLDPYIGFFHRPRFGRPALSLDLAEEFRPLIGDSVVVGVINNREIRASHFITRAGGVALTPEGRRIVLRAYERRLDTEVRHGVFGYTITYRRVLEVQTRLLAACLLREIPAYRPFSTR